MTRGCQRKAATLVCLAIASGACAEEFSWQISGGAHRTDLPSDVRSDAALVEATYYFRPVDDSSGPYAIAAFLNRSSRLSAAIQRTRTERIVAYVPPLTGERVQSQSTDESDLLSVRGRHVWRNTGWFAGGGLEIHDLPDYESSSVDADAEKYGFTVVGGKYLARSTALELSFHSTRESIEFAPVFTCVPLFDCTEGVIAIDSENETEEAAVSVMHAGGGDGLRYSVTGRILARDTKLSLRSRLIGQIDPAPVFPRLAYGGVVSSNAGAGTVSLPTQHEYFLAGEIFPGPRLGIRFGYTSYSDSPSLGDRYELGTTWFFKRKIAAQFLLATTEIDFAVPNASRDEALIRIIGRL